MALPKEFVDGRTDLVFELVAKGISADVTDADGVSLLQWCAYYGDVSAIRFLVNHGAQLTQLGEDLGLIGACFHGHWQLCQFLIEQGADPSRSSEETLETPLHATLCNTRSLRQNRVLRVLLAAGANPNCHTKSMVETGGFMRDSRTKGETPLHRAAAFADEEGIQLLLDAGAKLDAKDMNGDSPLSWASWHLRPSPILRKLCFGPYRIRSESKGMEAHLLGEPHAPEKG